jgi:hypothetical protein
MLFCSAVGGAPAEVLLVDAAGAELCPVTDPGTQARVNTVASAEILILLCNLCALSSAHSVLNLFTLTFSRNWEILTE